MLCFGRLWRAVMPTSMATGGAFVESRVCERVPPRTERARIVQSNASEVVYGFVANSSTTMTQQLYELQLQKQRDKALTPFEWSCWLVHPFLGSSFEHLGWFPAPLCLRLLGLCRPNPFESAAISGRFVSKCANSGSLKSTSASPKARLNYRAT